MSTKRHDNRKQTLQQKKQKEKQSNFPLVNVGHVATDQRFRQNLLGAIVSIDETLLLIHKELKKIRKSLPIPKEEIKSDGEKQEETEQED